MILRDIPSTPAPIRSMYVKEAEDIKSLRVKERNSWKDLSKDEKVTRKFRLVKYTTIRSIWMSRISFLRGVGLL